MTTAPIFGGPTKAAIIDRAYGFCAQSTTEFQLSPEEYTAGLQALNDVMALNGVTSYYQPPNGNGSPSDESGLLADEVLGAAVMVAQQIKTGIGKTFSPNALQQRGMDLLVSRYTKLAYVELGRQTIRGQGNRYWTGSQPYFITAAPDGEEPQ